jgi:hypothetical protein
MKPVESNVSPYLQQPLRTLDEVRQERERREQELAAATTTPKPASAVVVVLGPQAATPGAGTAAPAAPQVLVDQTA